MNEEGGYLRSDVTSATACRGPNERIVKIAASATSFIVSQLCCRTKTGATGLTDVLGSIKGDESRATAKARIRRSTDRRAAKGCGAVVPPELAAGPL